MGTDAPILELRDLRKSFISPLLRKTIPAVQGISLDVVRGEVFGFLGPNGAGKTTTIRMMMGLIKRTSGTIKLFGHDIPSREARKQVGFLPEAPYFYDYLTVFELLDLTGRLFGQSRSERRRRAQELIERVGLKHASATALRKYSKGMMQRAGIAQALMNDPNLIVCDEPMSGLDPLGRKLVRDILLEQKAAGKTVFFSSHILSDVEAISDRVAIVVQGQLHDLGAPHELVAGSRAGHEIVVALNDEDDSWLSTFALETLPGNRLKVTTDETTDLDEVWQLCRHHKARIVDVRERHQSLEDLFVERTKQHHTIHAEMKKAAR